MWKSKESFKAINNVVCPNCGYSVELSSDHINSISTIVKCDKCETTLDVVIVIQAEVTTTVLSQ